MFGKGREEKKRFLVHSEQCSVHIQSLELLQPFGGKYGSFTSSFSNCVSSISFSCPTMVTKSSGNMSNMSDESGYLFLLLDIKGKGYSLSSLSTVLLATSYFIDVC